MVNVTSGVVPLDRIAWVVTEVADEVLAHIPREHIHGELMKQLREIATTVGHDLNPACVRFWDEMSHDDRYLRSKWGARWQPPANSNLEMVGGANDGRIVHGRDESPEGYPVSMIRMPVADSFAKVDDYRLVGFRNDSVRWVYEAA